MNLGLVVLSAENKVFFQATLVTSLSTRFTSPAAGQYTIVPFRISLVEPALTQSATVRQKHDVPTVFQVQGSLTAN